MGNGTKDSGLRSGRMPRFVAVQVGVVILFSGDLQLLLLLQAKLASSFYFLATCRWSFFCRRSWRRHSFYWRVAAAPSLAGQGSVVILFSGEVLLLLLLWPSWPRHFFSSDLQLLRVDEWE